MSLFDNPEEQTCPKCGTSNPREILYGFPSQEMFDAANLGEISLGGCVIQGDDPAFECRSCGETFGML